QVRRFFARIQDARSAHPALVGCFIVGGALDPDLLRISGLGSEIGFFCFGLSQPDVLTDIHRRLATYFQIGLPGASIVSSANGTPERSVAGAEPQSQPPSLETSYVVGQQLTDFEAQRAGEQAELRARIDALQAELASSPRSQAVVTVGTHDPN